MIAAAMTWYRLFVRASWLVAMFSMLFAAIGAGAAGLYSRDRTWLLTQTSFGPNNGFTYTLPTPEVHTDGLLYADSSAYWLYAAGCALVLAVACAYVAYLSRFGKKAHP